MQHGGRQDFDVERLVDGLHAVEHYRVCIVGLAGNGVCKVVGRVVGSQNSHGVPHGVSHGIRLPCLDGSFGILVRGELVLPLVSGLALERPYQTVRGFYGARR